MILLVPEPTMLTAKGGFTPLFCGLTVHAVMETDTVMELARLRFWNYPDLKLNTESI